RRVGGETQGGGDHQDEGKAGLHGSFGFVILSTAKNPECCWRAGMTEFFTAFGMTGMEMVREEGGLRRASYGSG
ncbi:MAG: hypothetical protein ACHQ5A_11025, partial [Opitutales bacterium]